MRQFFGQMTNLGPKIPDSNALLLDNLKWKAWIKKSDHTPDRKKLDKTVVKVARMGK